MLVECRTCGDEFDSPISADLYAAQCGACRQDAAERRGEERVLRFLRTAWPMAVDTYRKARRARARGKRP